MSDFGKIMGTLLASLAHARRITDEETAVIAEYYKDTPLLEGMSVPRVRVPELKIELPMLIKSFEEGTEPILEENPAIINSILEELQIVFEKHELHLEQKFKRHFQKELENDLDRLRFTPADNFKIQGEHVSRIVDEVFASSANKYDLREQSSQTTINQIAKKLRSHARNIAFKRFPESPRIEASIITSEVKEQAAAGNVVRLQIAMKEEGLEWDIVNNPDGTTSTSLSPE